MQNNPPVSENFQSASVQFLHGSRTTLYNPRFLTPVIAATDRALSQPTLYALRQIYKTVLKIESDEIRTECLTIMNKKLEESLLVNELSRQTFSAQSIISLLNELVETYPQITDAVLLGLFQRGESERKKPDWIKIVNSALPPSEAGQQTAARVVTKFCERQDYFTAQSFCKFLQNNPTMNQLSIACKFALRSFFSHERMVGIFTGWKDLKNYHKTEYNIGRLLQFDDELYGLYRNAVASVYTLDAVRQLWANAAESMGNWQQNSLHLFLQSNAGYKRSEYDHGLNPYLWHEAQNQINTSTVVVAPHEPTPPAVEPVTEREEPAPRETFGQKLWRILNKPIRFHQ